MGGVFIDRKGTFVAAHTLPAAVTLHGRRQSSKLESYSYDYIWLRIFLG